MMPTLVMDDPFSGLFLFSIYSLPFLFFFFHFYQDGHQDVIVSDRLKMVKMAAASSDDEESEHLFFLDHRRI
jgi:hypothetical protein